MTLALVAALKAVNEQIPCMIDALVTDTLPAGKQHEFGKLLIALGELLGEYADAEGESPIPQRGPAMPLR